MRAKPEIYKPSRGAFPSGGAPPSAGEVLVEIRAAGVCHSDYHVMSGQAAHPLPVVLGHEGAGVVTALGEGVERLKVGDHVVLNWIPVTVKPLRQW